MEAEQTRVGVVGLGYVGLPLALAMHDAGYDVVGVDVDPDKVERLRSGESTVNDITDDEVAEASLNGLTFTTDYDRLADADGVSICVPTPLRKTDTPDLSYVLDAAERLAPVVDDCTVVLESTVYPGATKEAAPMTRTFAFDSAVPRSLSCSTTRWTTCWGISRLTVSARSIKRVSTPCWSAFQER